MTSLSSLDLFVAMLLISLAYSSMLASFMIISLLMHISISSHFIVYLSVASCSFAN